MNVLWRSISFVFVIFIAAICGGCGDNLTIHNPNEKTFFLPNDDEPLVVLLSFPDTWEPNSAVMMMLLNEDGGVERTQGTIPMHAPATIEPGSIAGQARNFHIPAGTDPGWHTIRAVGFRRLDDGSTETIRADSERFWISKIDDDLGNAGLIVVLDDRDGPPTVHPGGEIEVYSFPWGGTEGVPSGFSCPDTAPRVMLFKGGSHGRSHQHWQLEGDIRYEIPDDVPLGTHYFIWATQGPQCNGVSSIFPIVAR